MAFYCCKSKISKPRLHQHSNKQHIDKTELDFQAIIELPIIRTRAKQIISASFSLPMRLSTESNKNLEVEIATYQLTIMLASGTEDLLLIEDLHYMRHNKLTISKIG